MLHYAVVFFLIAMIVVLFGFGGLAVSTAFVAKILFLFFVVCAVLSMILGSLPQGNLKRRREAGLD